MISAPQPARSNSKLGSGCLFLFGLAVFGFPVGCLFLVAGNARGSIVGMVLGAGILLAFAVVGIGIMVFAWKAPRRAREQQERELRHPGEPWLWRPDWEQGFVQAERGIDARLRLATLPGVLGGRLEGRIEARAAAPAAGGVELTLECVRWRPAGRTTARRVVWQEKSDAAAQQGANGAEVPVSFEIPYDLDAVGPSGSWGERVLWQLTARAADRSFRARFSIPVFRTAASDATRTREALEAREGARLAGRGLPSGPYVFSGRKYRVAASGFGLFGLVLLAIAVFLWQAPSTGLIGTVVAGGIGLLMTVAGLWLWFGSLTVTASAAGLRIKSSCLGLSRVRNLAPAEIRGFQIRIGGQQGSFFWHDVYVRLADGRTILAAIGLVKSDAEQFVACLRRDLGL